jgi:hypothetical protein
MSARASKRQCVRELRPSAPLRLMELSIEIQSRVLEYVAQPEVLLRLALSCHALYDLVRRMPAWAATGLVGGQLFQATPLPMARALAVLLYGRCELCRRRAGPHPYHRFGWCSSTWSAEFGVYAHSECLSQQLIGDYHLTPNQLPRLAAARSLAIRHEGRQAYGYSMRLNFQYWKLLHPLIAPHNTVQGVEVLTLADAAAAGDAYWAAHAPARDMACVQYARAAARAAAVVTARKDKIAAATLKRRKALEAALAVAALPSIAQLGPQVACVDAFLSLRLSTPYSVKAAVARVRACVEVASA